MNGLISIFEGFSFSQNINLSLDPVPGDLNRNFLEADIMLMPGNLVFNVAGSKGWDQVLPFFGPDGVTSMSLKESGIKTDGIYYLNMEGPTEKKIVPFMIISDSESDHVPSNLYLVQPANTITQPNGFQLSPAFKAISASKWTRFSPGLGPNQSFQVKTKTGKIVSLTFSDAISANSFKFNWEFLPAV